MSPVPDPECVLETRCGERRHVLRELIEQRIAHERELAQTMLESRDGELRKEAAEYARRLDELNHALKTMLDERRMFYSRDMHDIFMVEYRTFQDVTRRQLTTIYTWGAAGLLGLTILEFVIRLLWR